MLSGMSDSGQGAESGQLLIWLQTFLPSALKGLHINNRGCSPRQTTPLCTSALKGRHICKRGCSPGEPPTPGPSLPAGRGAPLLRQSPKAGAIHPGVDLSPIHSPTFPYFCILTLHLALCIQQNFPITSIMPEASYECSIKWPDIIIRPRMGSYIPTPSFFYKHANPPGLGFTG
jgi:hypothetical protein